MDIREKIEQMIEPRNDNTASRIYDIVMLTAFVLAIIPLMHKEYTLLYLYFDLFAGVCFIIDYILRWIVADKNSKLKGVWAWIVYPFTPLAIIDLLSILPTFALISSSFRVARAIRLAKILRLLKLVHYYEPLLILRTVVMKQRKMLLSAMAVVLFYTFLTALVMFNEEHAIDPATGKPVFENFLAAFYWSVCTLTTIGFGDIHPVSDLGRIICTISSLIGVAIIALPTGVIAAGYINELNERKESETSHKLTNNPTKSHPDNGNDTATGR